jgi:diaminopimelate decarboxylase
MHDFRYVRGQLHCEGVAIESLVRKFGTPLYVYSEHTLRERFERLHAALAPLDHLICYALKANSNLAVLRTFAGLGAGFDLVSGGELQRVLAAGGDAGRCVFAGVGKSEREIALALRAGIYCFNAESEPELARINRVAAGLGVKAPVAVRVNPNVDAHTHAKITTGTYENKFGIPFEDIPAVYGRTAKLKHLCLRGIQMHIGSQLTEVQPFRQAVERIAPLAQELRDRHGIEFFSVGGGIGIVYQPALASGDPKWWRSPAARGILTPATYAATLVPLLRPLGLRVLLEPGRFLVGNAGILVTRVEHVKRTGRKNFVIVDAAMNDLIRPAFYDAYHEIVPLRKSSAKLQPCDVVGPICESGDYFAKDRPLPKLGEGDGLALLSAGAYGSVMGSNYNSRALPAEVMVRSAKVSVVRARQPVEAVWAHERLAAWQQ